MAAYLASGSRRTGPKSQCEEADIVSFFAGHIHFRRRSKKGGMGGERGLSEYGGSHGWNGDRNKITIGYQTCGTRALRFSGYWGNRSRYQRWWDRARGARLAAVQTAKARPGRDQVATAQPIQMSISPK